MNKKQEKAVTERALDPELLAMKRITGILLKLPKPAALRIMQYVNGRLAEPRQAELPMAGEGDGKEAPQ